MMWLPKLLFWQLDRLDRLVNMVKDEFILGSLYFRAIRENETFVLSKSSARNYFTHVLPENFPRLAKVGFAERFSGFQL